VPELEEDVVGEPERDGDHERQQRDARRAARGRPRGGQQRAEHEQRDQDGVGADGRVHGGDEQHEGRPRPRGRAPLQGDPADHRDED